ncbi:MAG: hypothetical protein V1798_12035 [Pseudomonadota bacterium]
MRSGILILFRKIGPALGLALLVPCLVLGQGNQPNPQELAKTAQAVVDEYTRWDGKDPDAFMARLRNSLRGTSEDRLYDAIEWLLWKIGRTSYWETAWKEIQPRLMPTHQEVVEGCLHSENFSPLSNQMKGLPSTAGMRFSLAAIRNALVQGLLAALDCARSAQSAVKLPREVKFDPSPGKGAGDAREERAPASAASLEKRFLQRMAQALVRLVGSKYQEAFKAAVRGIPGLEETDAMGIVDRFIEGSRDPKVNSPERFRGVVVLPGDKDSKYLETWTRILGGSGISTADLMAARLNPITEAEICEHKIIGFSRLVRKGIEGGVTLPQGIDAAALMIDSERGSFRPIALTRDQKSLLRFLLENPASLTVDNVASRVWVLHALRGTPMADVIGAMHWFVQAARFQNRDEQGTDTIQHLVSEAHLERSPKLAPLVRTILGWPTMIDRAGLRKQHPEATETLVDRAIQEAFSLVVHAVQQGVIVPPEGYSRELVEMGGAKRAKPRVTRAAPGDRPEAIRVGNANVSLHRLPEGMRLLLQPIIRTPKFWTELLDQVKPGTPVGDMEAGWIQLSRQDAGDFRTFEMSLDLKGGDRRLFVMRLMDEQELRLLRRMPPDLDFLPKYAGHYVSKDASGHPRFVVAFLSSALGPALSTIENYRERYLQEIFNGAEALFGAISRTSSAARELLLHVDMRPNSVVLTDRPGTSLVFTGVTARAQNLWRTLASFQLEFVPASQVGRWYDEILVKYFPGEISALVLEYQARALAEEKALRRDEAGPRIAIDSRRQLADRLRTAGKTLPDGGINPFQENGREPDIAAIPRFKFWLERIERGDAYQRRLAVKLLADWIHTMPARPGLAGAMDRVLAVNGLSSELRREILELRQLPVFPTSVEIPIPAVAGSEVETFQSKIHNLARRYGWAETEFLHNRGEGWGINVQRAGERLRLRVILPRKSAPITKAVLVTLEAMAEFLVAEPLLAGLKADSQGHKDLSVEEIEARLRDKQVSSEEARIVWAQNNLTLAALRAVVNKGGLPEFSTEYQQAKERLDIAQRNDHTLIELLRSAPPIPRTPEKPASDRKGPDRPDTGIIPPTDPASMHPPQDATERNAATEEEIRIQVERLTAKKAEIEEMRARQLERHEPEGRHLPDLGALEIPILSPSQVQDPSKVSRSVQVSQNQGVFDVQAPTIVRGITTHKELAECVAQTLSALEDPVSFQHIAPFLNPASRPPIQDLLGALERGGPPGLTPAEQTLLARTLWQEFHTRSQLRPLTAQEEVQREALEGRLIPLGLKSTSLPRRALRGIGFPLYREERPGLKVRFMPPEEFALLERDLAHLGSKFQRKVAVFVDATRQYLREGEAARVFMDGGEIRCAVSGTNLPEYLAPLLESTVDFAARYPNLTDWMGDLPENSPAVHRDRLVPGEGDQQQKLKVLLQSEAQLPGLKKARQIRTLPKYERSQLQSAYEFANSVRKAILVHLRFPMSARLLGELDAELSEAKTRKLSLRATWEMVETWIMRKKGGEPPASGARKSPGPKDEGPDQGASRPPESPKDKAPPDGGSGEESKGPPLPPPADKERAQGSRTPRMQAGVSNTQVEIRRALIDEILKRLSSESAGFKNVRLRMGAVPEKTPDVKGLTSIHVVRSPEGYFDVVGPAFSTDRYPSKIQELGELYSLIMRRAAEYMRIQDQQPLIVEKVGDELFEGSLTERELTDLETQLLIRSVKHAALLKDVGPAGGLFPFTTHLIEKVQRQIRALRGKNPPGRGDTDQGRSGPPKSPRDNEPPAGGSGRPPPSGSGPVALLTEEGSERAAPARPGLVPGTRQGIRGTSSEVLAEELAAFSNVKPEGRIPPPPKTRGLAAPSQPGDENPPREPSSQSRPAGKAQAGSKNGKPKTSRAAQRGRQSTVDPEIILSRLELLTPSERTQIRATFERMMGATPNQDPGQVLQAAVARIVRDSAEPIAQRRVKVLDSLGREMFRVMKEEMERTLREKGLPLGDLALGQLEFLFVSFLMRAQELARSGVPTAKAAVQAFHEAKSHENLLSLGGFVVGSTAVQLGSQRILSANFADALAGIDSEAEYKIATAVFQRASSFMARASLAPGIYLQNVISRYFQLGHVERAFVQSQVAPNLNYFELDRMMGSLMGNPSPGLPGELDPFIGLLSGGMQGEVSPVFDRIFQEKLLDETMSAQTKFGEALLTDRLLDVAVSAAVITVAGTLSHALVPVPLLGTALTIAIAVALESEYRNLRDGRTPEEYAATWSEKRKKHNARSQDQWKAATSTLLRPLTLHSFRVELKAPIEREAYFWGDVEGEAGRLIQGVFQPSLVLFLDNVQKHIVFLEQVARIPFNQRRRFFESAAAAAVSPGQFIDRVVVSRAELVGRLEALASVTPEDVADTAYRFLRAAQGIQEAEPLRNHRGVALSPEALASGRRFVEAAGKLRVLGRLAQQWLAEEDGAYHQLKILLDRDAQARFSSHAFWDVQLPRTVAQFLRQDSLEAATRISMTGATVESAITKLLAGDDRLSFIQRLIVRAERTLQ